jgi:hypothetical protein
MLERRNDRLTVIAVTVYRYGRTPSYGRSGNDLQQSLSRSSPTSSPTTSGTRYRPSTVDCHSTKKAVIEITGVDFLE